MHAASDTHIIIFAFLLRDLILFLPASFYRIVLHISRILHLFLQASLLGFPVLLLFFWKRLTLRIKLTIRISAC